MVVCYSADQFCRAEFGPREETDGSADILTVLLSIKHLFIATQPILNQEKQIGEELFRLFSLQRRKDPEDHKDQGFL